MATTIGRLMPKRTPAEDANEQYTFKTDSVGTYYETFNALTPDKAKKIIQMAEIMGEIGPLFDIYDRMESTDTRYGGLVGSMKASIGGLRLRVVAANASEGSEKEIADDYARSVKEMLVHLDTQNVTKAFTDPYFVGSKLYKMRWDMVEYAYNRRMWMPAEVAPVEGKYLLVNKDFKGGNYGKMMVRTEDNHNGRLIEDLPLGSALWLEDGYGNDRYAKIGRARKCLPWYLGIMFVQSWWVQYIEGYGSPLRIGRHPRGASPTSRANMERFLKVLGQHGYALFPNDMEVQLLEANRQGTITTYRDFIAKGHEEYSVALVGQASTVGSAGSTAPYAGAVVANSIRHENLHDAASIASRGWHKLVDQFIRINYGKDYVKRLLPKVTPVLITPAEINTKADAAIKAQDNGVPVREDFWYDQVLGTERPLAGERAVLFGQTYDYGVDPTPQPREKKGTAGEEEKPRDRSVSSPAGNPTYEKRTA